mgnify:CR=1 FL=1
MKKVSVVLSVLPLLILISFTPFAGVVGKMFPTMSGETVKDKKVNLPKDLNGKFSVLCLAYSEEAEKSLQTWMESVFDKFVAGTDLMPCDVLLYFVPMFTGSKAASAGLAKSKLLKDSDPAWHPHILIYKGELDPVKTPLEMENKKVPYVFVLDAKGKIIYATSGNYSEEKMDAIEDVLE